MRLEYELVSPGLPPVSMRDDEHLFVVLKINNNGQVVAGVDVGVVDERARRLDLDTFIAQFIRPAVGVLKHYT